jgi:hypothetical protein
MILSLLKPLPLYVSPVRGESATSLASRIARKNGTAILAAKSDLTPVLIGVGAGDQRCRSWLPAHDESS